MRRKALITFAVIITIATLSFSINAEEINSLNTDIKISSKDSIYTVEETIKIDGPTDDFIGIIKFWIQDEAQDVTISVNNENIDYEASNNLYTTNLSELEIKQNSQPTIKINYKLNKNIDNFEKDIIRNTSSFKVTFNENILQTSTDLISGTSISLYLYQPTEAESDLNIYFIIGIIILLVILIIVLINNTRKPKQTKTKKTMIESEELLSTKKAILMSLLKDIEKKHRSKDISDDTYHKLKSHYKNEAVETMKKLEDMGSKVK
jgi:hypothetical protein